MLTIPAPFRVNKEPPGREKAPSKESVRPVGTFNGLMTPTVKASSLDIVKSVVAPDISMPDAPSVRVATAELVVIATGPAGFKILTPLHEAFAPRSFVALFGSVMVASHTATSLIPGATPPTQDGPRFKAPVVLAFGIFAALAEVESAAAARLTPRIKYVRFAK